MNARTVILAFLAERSPGAYSETAIAQRVNASGLLDAPVLSPRDDLEFLGSGQVDILVRRDINPLSKEAVWYATDLGVRVWNKEGRLHVN